MKPKLPKDAPKATVRKQTNEETQFPVNYVIPKKKESKTEPNKKKHSLNGDVTSGNMITPESHIADEAGTSMSTVTDVVSEPQEDAKDTVEILDTMTSPNTESAPVKEERKSSSNEIKDTTQQIQSKTRIKQKRQSVSSTAKPKQHKDTQKATVKKRVDSATQFPADYVVPKKKDKAEPKNKKHIVNNDDASGNVITKVSQIAEDAGTSHTPTTSPVTDVLSEPGEDAKVTSIPVMQDSEQSSAPPITEDTAGISNTMTAQADVEGKTIISVIKDTTQQGQPKTQTVQKRQSVSSPVKPNKHKDAPKAIVRKRIDKATQFPEDYVIPPKKENQEDSGNETTMVSHTAEEAIIDVLSEPGEDEKVTSIPVIEDSEESSAPPITEDIADISNTMTPRNTETVIDKEMICAPEEEKVKTSSPVNKDSTQQSESKRTSEKLQLISSMVKPKKTKDAPKATGRKQKDVATQFPLTYVIPKLIEVKAKPKNKKHIVNNEIVSGNVITPESQIAEDPGTSQTSPISPVTDVLSETEADAKEELSKTMTSPNTETVIDKEMISAPEEEKGKASIPVIKDTKKQSQSKPRTTEKRQPISSTIKSNKPKDAPKETVRKQKDKKEKEEPKNKKNIVNDKKSSKNVPTNVSHIAEEAGASETPSISPAADVLSETKEDEKVTSTPVMEDSEQSSAPPITEDTAEISNTMTSPNTETVIDKEIISAPEEEERRTTVPEIKDTTQKSQLKSRVAQKSQPISSTVKPKKTKDAPKETVKKQIDKKDKAEPKNKKHIVNDKKASENVTTNVSHKAEEAGASETMPISTVNDVLPEPVKDETVTNIPNTEPVIENEIVSAPEEKDISIAVVKEIEDTTPITEDTAEMSNMMTPPNTEPVIENEIVSAPEEKDISIAVVKEIEDTTPITEDTAEIPNTMEPTNTEYVIDNHIVSAPDEEEIIKNISATNETEHLILSPTTEDTTEIKNNMSPPNTETVTDIEPISVIEEEEKRTTVPETEQTNQITEDTADMGIQANTVDEVDNEILSALGEDERSPRIPENEETEHTTPTNTEIAIDNEVLSAPKDDEVPINIPVIEETEDTTLSHITKDISEMLPPKTESVIDKEIISSPDEEERLISNQDVLETEHTTLIQNTEDTTDISNIVIPTHPETSICQETSAHEIDEIELKKTTEKLNVIAAILVANVIAKAQIIVNKEMATEEETSPSRGKDETKETGSTSPITMPLKTEAVIDNEILSTEEEEERGTSIPVTETEDTTLPLITEDTADISSSWVIVTREEAMECPIPLLSITETIMQITEEFADTAARSIPIETLDTRDGTERPHMAVTTNTTPTMAANITDNSRQNFTIGTLDNIGETAAETNIGTHTMVSANPKPTTEETITDTSSQMFTRETEYTTLPPSTRDTADIINPMISQDAETFINNQIVSMSDEENRTSIQIIIETENVALPSITENRAEIRNTTIPPNTINVIDCDMLYTEEDEERRTSIPEIIQAEHSMLPVITEGASEISNIVTPAYSETSICQDTSAPAMDETIESKKTTEQLNLIAAIFVASVIAKAQIIVNKERAMEEETSPSRGKVETREIGITSSNIVEESIEMQIRTNQLGETMPSVHLDEYQTDAESVAIENISPSLCHDESQTKVESSTMEDISLFQCHDEPETKQETEIMDDIQPCLSHDESQTNEESATMDDIQPCLCHDESQTNEESATKDDILSSLRHDESQTNAESPTMDGILPSLRHDESQTNAESATMVDISLFQCHDEPETKQETEIMEDISPSLRLDESHTNTEPPPLDDTLPCLRHDESQTNAESPIMDDILPCLGHDESQTNEESATKDDILPSLRHDASQTNAESPTLDDILQSLRHDESQTNAESPTMDDILQSLRHDESQTNAESPTIDDILQSLRHDESQTNSESPTMDDILQSLRHDQSQTNAESPTMDDILQSLRHDQSQTNAESPTMEDILPCLRHDESQTRADSVPMEDITPSLCHDESETHAGSATMEDITPSLREYESETNAESATIEDITPSECHDESKNILPLITEDTAEISSSWVIVSREEAMECLIVSSSTPQSNGKDQTKQTGSTSPNIVDESIEIQPKTNVESATMEETMPSVHHDESQTNAESGPIDDITPCLRQDEYQTNAESASIEVSMPSLHHDESETNAESAAIDDILPSVRHDESLTNAESAEIDDILPSLRHDESLTNAESAAIDDILPSVRHDESLTNSESAAIEDILSSLRHDESLTNAESAAVEDILSSLRHDESQTNTELEPIDDNTPSLRHDESQSNAISATLEYATPSLHQDESQTNTESATIEDITPCICHDESQTKTESLPMDGIIPSLHHDESLTNTESVPMETQFWDDEIVSEYDDAQLFSANEAISQVDEIAAPLNIHILSLDDTKPFTSEETEPSQRHGATAIQPINEYATLTDGIASPIRLEESPVNLESAEMESANYVDTNYWPISPPISLDAVGIEDTLIPPPREEDTTIESTTKSSSTEVTAEIESTTISQAQAKIENHDSPAAASITARYDVSQDTRDETEEAHMVHTTHDELTTIESDSVNMVPLTNEQSDAVDDLTISQDSQETHESATADTMEAKHTDSQRTTTETFNTTPATMDTAEKKKEETTMMESVSTTAVDSAIFVSDNENETEGNDTIEEMESWVSIFMDEAIECPTVLSNTETIMRIPDTEGQSFLIETLETTDETAADTNIRANTMISPNTTQAISANITDTSTQRFTIGTLYPIDERAAVYEETIQSIANTARSVNTSESRAAIQRTTDTVRRARTLIVNQGFTDRGRPLSMIETPTTFTERGRPMSMTETTTTTTDTARRRTVTIVTPLSTTRTSRASRSPVSATNAAASRSHRSRVSPSLMKRLIEHYQSPPNTSGILNVAVTPDATRTEEVSNTSEAPDATHIEEVSNMSEAPDVTRAEKVSNTIETPDATRPEEVSNTSEAPNATRPEEVSNTSEAPDATRPEEVSNMSDISNTTRIEEVSNTSVTPTTARTSKMFTAIRNVEIPNASEKPNATRREEVSNTSEITNTTRKAEMTNTTVTPNAACTSKMFTAIRTLNADDANTAIAQNTADTSGIADTPMPTTHAATGTVDIQDTQLSPNTTGTTGRPRTPDPLTNAERDSLMFFMVALMIAVLACMTLLAPGVRSKLHSPTTPWWKSTIIYQVYPRSFQDSNGDGVGDIQGVISRLSHFTYLNVGAIWLSPFYTSPMRDFGYDVSNYTDVDPIFGNIGDFDKLIKDAHAKGIKVIIDFVPNHSSNESEWFQKSRMAAEGESYRDFYVWNDGKVLQDGSRAPPNNWESVFGGSAWHWDDARQAYYYHAFLDSQPDLNFRNEEVLNEMDNVLRFWLNKGVDGFRVDAIPHLFELQDQSVDEPPGASNGFDPDLHKYTKNQPEVYGVVRRWRSVLDEYEPEDGAASKFLLAETVGIPYEARQKYYQAGSVPFFFDLIPVKDECTQGTLASCFLKAISEGLNVTSGQWPNFVIGNHDNRRIADRIGKGYVDVMNMLLLTLPGTPTTYYGEELGMSGGDYRGMQPQDPYAITSNNPANSRDSERNPMQWDATYFAGFTNSTSGPWLPITSNTDNMHVNVEVQKATPGSSLRLYQQLAILRRQPDFQEGSFVASALPTDEILSYRRGNYLVALNLGTTSGSIRFEDAAKGSIVFATRVSRGSSVDLDDVTLSPGEGVIILLNYAD